MIPDLGVRHKAYMNVHVESTDPGELILLAYSAAIQSCEKRDMRRAGEAIYELMNGLDFAYEEMAGQLVVLYDWIYRLIKEGQFDDAKRFLIELRQAWEGALEKSRADRAAVADRAAAVTERASVGGASG